MQIIKNLISRAAVCLLFGHWLVFIYLAQFFNFLAHKVEDLVCYCSSLYAKKLQTEQEREQAEFERMREDLEKLL